MPLARRFGLTRTRFIGSQALTRRRWPARRRRGDGGVRRTRILSCGANRRSSVRRRWPVSRRTRSGGAARARTFRRRRHLPRGHAFDRYRHREIPAGRGRGGRCGCGGLAFRGPPHPDLDRGSAAARSSDAEDRLGARYVRLDADWPADGGLGIDVATPHAALCSCPWRGRRCAVPTRPRWRASSTPAADTVGDRAACGAPWGWS